MLLGIGVAAPLGPTSATAIRRGLVFGAWAAFWVGLGAALTDFFYIFLTYLGVVPLIERIPALEPVLYLVGAFVLGRMAFSAIREGISGGIMLPTMATPGIAEQHTWRAGLVLGIGVTVVNPATITSWLSVGGAFVVNDLATRPFHEALGGMLAVFIGSAAWFSVLATIVGVARSSIGRLPWLFRAVGIASGCILLAFAIVFAWKGVTEIV
jgi:threonine/homoserine/homoserine lactone efflux protein